MKKNLLLAGAAFVMGLCTVQAQNFVPNGDLEGWQTITTDGQGNPVTPYETTTSAMLATLNKISTYPSNPPITAFKDGNAHGGSFCAKIVSAVVPPPVGVFVPGVLGSVDPYFNPSGFGTPLAVPFVGLPEKLTAWIKYTTVQGDSGEIFSYLHRNNAGVRETIAVASRKYYQNITSWTQQELTYNYLVSNTLPDSISLIFVSSAGYNFVNLGLCQGKVGSTMWIDDVALVGYAGISEMIFNGEQINVYPSPAEDLVNVSVTQEIQHGVLSVTDMNGREVLSKNISGNLFSLDVNTLKAGNYVVVLKQNSTILGRKTFLKK